MPSAETWRPLCISCALPVENSACERIKFFPLHSCAQKPSNHALCSPASRFVSPCVRCANLWLVSGDCTKHLELTAAPYPGKFTAPSRISSVCSEAQPAARQHAGNVGIGNRTGSTHSISNLNSFLP